MHARNNGMALAGLRVLLAVGLIGLSAGQAPRHGQAETLLERGSYFVRHVAACGNCHTVKGPQGDVPGMELAGGMQLAEEAFSVTTPNITPDQETGIGGWSDAQIITAIREGRRPDGSVLGPPMPFMVYRGLSDRDVQAVVAYLRSVKAVKNRVPRNTYPFPLPPAWGPPVASVPDVPREERVRYGAYLAGPVAHCTVCHTPAEGPVFKFDTHLGAGGFPLKGPWGTVFSANITPDPRFGIGQWKDAEIRRAIKEGVSKTHGALVPIMPYPYYTGMTDSDVQAITAWLRSLKPVAQERKVRLTPPKG